MTTQEKSIASVHGTNNWQIPKKEDDQKANQSTVAAKPRTDPKSDWSNNIDKKPMVDPKDMPKKS